MVLQLSEYFFRARPEDIKIIESLGNAFQHTDRMRTLINKKGTAFKSGVNVVVSYIYFMVKKMGGIFISNNKATYLLYYQNSQHYSSVRDFLHYIYMAFSVVGIQRLWKNFTREKTNKAIRFEQIQKNNHQDYLYVWMLAQRKEEKSIAGLLEAKQHIIDEASKLNLPIYMETTDQRLVPLYERAGFRFYQSRKDETTGLTFWFGIFEH